MGVSHHQCKFADRIMRRHARAVVMYTALFGLCIALLPQNGIAQQKQSENNFAALPAVVVAKPTEIENVTNIKAQPLALLAKFPDAGPAMARFVAQQLTQQPAMIDAMLSIVKDTSPAQASAMGAGIVRAVRALGTKQPTASRAITEKVMGTDNKYLTTTFVSLGPRYNGSGAFVAPASLPPHEIIAGDDLGISANGAWRVGPAENNSMTNRDPNLGTDGSQKCTDYTIDYANNSCRGLGHGMIVAVMKSDASSNGAVSTSPTI